MNRGPFIFLGILFSLAISFWGLIFIPQAQIGRQGQTNTLDTLEIYPAARAGLAKRGAEVYRAEGCVECHTEQVRASAFNTDTERGWGIRFTVARDYLGDSPVMLGMLRVGPDLANVSARRPDARWHLQHLYDPQVLVPGSLMPPYRYLFEKRRLGPGEKPSARAIDAKDVPEGWEIVPSEDADALVAYLLSLRADAELFEAPVPKDKRRAPVNVPVGTNATNTATAPATNAASVK